MDYLRSLGQTVLIKHRWNQNDVTSGLAKICPACFESSYGSTYPDCQICFGVGYVSVQNDTITNKWIENGFLVSSDGGDHVQAPQYGGFGPGYLTYIVQADTPTDVFKDNPEGVQIDARQGQSHGPWSPKMGDGDICINVDIGLNMQTILQANERYDLKMVQPVTIRGWGLHGKHQQYLVGQSFIMAQIPLNNPFYNIPYDR